VLLEIFLVHLAAMASPGPNVLLVTHTAMARSRGAGLRAALGVAAGSGLWAASAAIGLGLVLARGSVAGDVAAVLGGLYLVALGARTIRGATRPVASVGDDRAGGAARRGLLTNLSNPKAAVFFLSVFATLLPAEASPGLRVAAVGVVLVDSLVWHALLAIVCSTRPARDAYARARRWIDRVAGAVMVGFGVRLATRSLSP
jgi:threonine efflux protein